MRVLQVHTRYREPGGEDAAVEADRQLLRAAGHQVDVVEASNPQGRLAAAGALATSWWNGHAADRVRDLAVRLRPEVVHVHNTWFALSPSVIEALSDLGIPLVMTLHNYRLRCAAGFERFDSYGPALSMMMILPLAVAVLAVFAPVPDDDLRAAIRTRHPDLDRT